MALWLHALTKSNVTNLGKCLQTLAEHLRPVASVQLDERRIVSASLDWTVRVWDRTTGRCLDVLEEHMRGVFSLRLDRQKVISGGGDRLIKVWDRDDDLWCVNTLRGHTGGPVLTLDCDDVRLVSGGADHTVRLWDFSDPNYVPARSGGGSSDLSLSVFGSSASILNPASSNEDCLIQ
jgi:WD40 repeat protein